MKIKYTPRKVISGKARDLRHMFNSLPIGTLIELYSKNEKLWFGVIETVTPGVDTEVTFHSTGSDSNIDHSAELVGILDFFDLKIITHEDKV